LATRWRTAASIADFWGGATTGFRAIVAISAILPFLRLS
jgi:hypothetical protein